MSETETDTFDWGELTEAWWREAGATCGATERQIRFACASHRGCTKTEAARQAGYEANEDSIRQQGHRTFQGTAVQNLLALAAAEAKGGTDGTVNSAESRRILSRLARGGDPSIRIRAVEALAKMDEAEAEQRRIAESFVGDPVDVLKTIDQEFGPEVAALIALKEGQGVLYNYRSNEIAHLRKIFCPHCLVRVARKYKVSLRLDLEKTLGGVTEIPPNCIEAEDASLAEPSGGLSQQSPTNGDGNVIAMPRQE